MLSKSMRKLITLIIAVIVALVLMRWLMTQNTEIVRHTPAVSQISRA